MRKLHSLTVFILQRMRSGIAVAAILAGVSLFASARALAVDGVPMAIEPVDQIAVIVNNDVITARELAQRVNLIENRLRQTHTPLPPMQQLSLQVLDQMILERLQLQRAKEDGLTVSDADIQNAVQRLAAANHMSPQTYQAQLQAQGISWPLFQSDLRKQLLLDKVRQAEVDSKVMISNDEVAMFLAHHRGPGLAMIDDLHLQHILIALPQNATAAQEAAAQQKVAMIMKAVNKGRDFGKLAEKYSQDKDASNGGDLGFQPPENLPAAYVSAASHLRPGEVLQTPIRTQQGLQILKLVERRLSRGPQGKTIAIVQTHAQHILLRVNNDASAQEVLKKILWIKQKIESGGDFSQYAKTYSQDGTAAQGGDLGWISPGETVPEFEQAMNQLQSGQIGGPVRTSFGYHLIRVLGRRTVEVPVAQEEQNARQIIGERKADQAYAAWLRQLRSNAYVRYMPGYGPNAGSDASGN